MNLLAQFINFLKNQKNTSSFLTIKNYKADVGQFIKWFEEEFGFPFDPSKINLRILEDYKKSRNLSYSSIERHTSSLRKFFNFLKAANVINFELFPQNYKKNFEPDPWHLKNFKNFLYEYKKSYLTIKNYINDIRSFFAWLEEASLTKYAWGVAERNLFNIINPQTIEEYKQRLFVSKFSPLTINRKLSSLRKYLNWAKNQEFISLSQAEFNLAPEPSYATKNEILKQANIQRGAQTNKAIYSSFPPIRLMQKVLGGANSLFDSCFIIPLAKIIENLQYLFWKTSGKKIFIKSTTLNPNPVSNTANIKKEFYAPLQVSLRYLPRHKVIWHYLRHVRPNWYKKYHSLSITHYLHFAILIILASAIGFGTYNEFFKEVPKEAVLSAAVSTPSPRILSFEGKLSDSQGNPIIKPTNILFSLYNQEDASEQASLWQENNLVKPDINGAFSISLGRNTPLYATFFEKNPELFLGITVGGTQLSPRQQLPTTSLASNSQMLLGLEPITNTSQGYNVILALDSSGNLNIEDSKTHTFQAIGGQLILSGNVLSLITAPDSNGNVEIAPYGLGKIDLLKPIQNSSNNNNPGGVAGAVEFDDLVAILATSSAQSALTINQNSLGALISASTSGIARFTVDNDGTGTFGGDVRIEGGDLESTNTTFNLLNNTVTTLNIGEAATIINLGVFDGTVNLKSNLSLGKDLILTSLTSNGGILYTNESGKVLQVSSGSSSDCLTGGSNPSFASCSKILSQVGNVGIGTTTPLFRLDIQDSQDATATAQIYNTSTNENADGLIVKLGNTSTSAVSNTNHFIGFETNGIGIVGSVRGDGATGVDFRTTGIADFAEYLKKDPLQVVEYGSLMCTNNGLVALCDSTNASLIGVASNHGGVTGGVDLGEGSVRVGFVGQIYIKVSTINGVINAGDALTLSSIPGVAVKAISAGQIIGKALEDLTTIDESKVVGYFDPDNNEYRNKASFPNVPLKQNIARVVKMPVLVSVSWYDPAAYLAQNGELTVRGTNPSNYSVSNSFNEALTNIGAFFEIIAANIKAGLINASEVITNTLVVTSDSVIINGQNLKDYIVRTVEESGLMNQESGILSPIVKTDQLSTNIISPLAKDSNISISLSDSQFIIHDSTNASGSAVAVVDNAGNASFSGELTSNSVITNNVYTDGLEAGSASISGTLRAGNILADSIEGLEAKVSNYVNLASYSAQLSYIPDFAAEHAQFDQGLIVFGSTSLSDLSVAGSLSVGGGMFIAENSIETLGTDLYLQSLRQGGLSIMSGLVYIDTAGNIKIQGDLSLKGSLAVNVISPLPSSDLVVNNASGSSVLSINQTGDIKASGSGTFAKLNLRLVEPALALSSTELIASSSAGTANINPYQKEITIKNALVTDKSVIYITPVGTPSAQAPFLLRQVPSDTWLRQQPSEANQDTNLGSFTVGVQSPTVNPIPFNWLIIN